MKYFMSISYLHTNKYLLKIILTLLLLEYLAVVKLHLNPSQMILLHLQCFLFEKISQIKKEQELQMKNEFDCIIHLT